MILFEANAAEKLTDSHVEQVLNCLAASKFRLGLLPEFRFRFSGMENLLLGIHGAKNSSGCQGGF